MRNKFENAEQDSGMRMKLLLSLIHICELKRTVEYLASLLADEGKLMGS